MIESYLDDAIDPARVRRVLVIKLRHFGDVLLTSPVFGVLKDHLPHAEIDALVYAETAPMLRHHPAVAQVHGIDRGWKQVGVLAQWRHERNLLATLRERRYDLIIHLTEHARGARLARRLKPRYAVARRYRSKRGRWWRNSFSHTYTVPSRPRHTVEVHLDALRRLGIYPAPDARALLFHPGEAAQEQVAGLLAEHGLRPGGYIVVHPTSRWLFKGWSRDAFATVIDTLQAGGQRLVLSAAPDAREMQLAADIVSRCEHAPLDLSGRLDLEQLGALIAHARLFVGLDSVPMHLAAAVATPCVALFGPSDEQTWGPWRVPHRVVSAALSCRPCNQDGCGNGKVADCLMTIEPAALLAAVQSLLAETAA